MTDKQVLQKLRRCKTFYDFLLCVRDTDGLEMKTDNGWYWLEFNGVEVEGTSKERFVSMDEMIDLMKLSGITGKRKKQQSFDVDDNAHDYLWK